jgi:spore coat protein JB
MLKDIGIINFVMVELNLYLDTHPHDEMALKKYEEYEAILKPLVRDFEKRFGPLTVSADNMNRFLWINNPWPWDTEEDC